MLASRFTSQENLSSVPLPKLAPIEVARDALSEISDCKAKSSDQARIITAKRLVVQCGSRYERALQTIEDLQLDTDRSREFIAELRAEFFRYVQVCELYARGYSYSWIQERTNEPVEQRLGVGSLPVNIRRFAGAELTQAEAAQRERTCSALETRALNAYRVANRRLKDLDGPKTEQRKNSLQVAFDKFTLVVSLYRRGLTPADIASLTGTPAARWLRRGSLPQAVEKGSRALRKAPHKVRVNFDKDSAYITGAYFASFAVFSPAKVLTFHSTSPEKLSSLRDKFKSSFAIEGSAVSERINCPGRFNFTIAQREFTRYLYDFLKVKDGKNPKIPFSAFQTEENRRSLLEGFFDFTKFTIGHSRPGVEILRSNQINVLYSIAAALYLENIYPLVGEIKKGTYLHIKTHTDLKRLLELIPSLTTRDDRRKVIDLPDTKEACLNSYHEYSSICRVLRLAFRDEREIDFALLFKLAAIDVAPEQVDANLRRKIRKWQNGQKPSVAVRASRIEEFIEDLYREEGGAKVFKNIAFGA